MKGHYVAPFHLSFGLLNTSETGITLNKIPVQISPLPSFLSQNCRYGLVKIFTAFYCNVTGIHLYLQHRPIIRGETANENIIVIIRSSKFV